jgi:hypothetical protein
MNFVALISYPISKKNLRYRWSKTLGLEPPPNIVPDIEDFNFDTEVMSSISKFMISLYYIKQSSKNSDIKVKNFDIEV